MARHVRSALLLTAAAVWAAWVVAHYYAFPFVAPDITDGVRGLHFPYWREAVTRALGSLGGVTVILLVAWGFGRLSTRAITRAFSRTATPSIFDHPVERVTYELACGFLALTVWLFGLAGLRAYQPFAIRVLLTCGAGLAVVLLIRSAFRAGRVHDFRSWSSTGTLLPAGGIVVTLAFASVAALAPETEYDALWYHLWLPQRWLEAGTPVDIVQEYVSLYPLSWELLYGAAMTVGGAGAAKLLHFACLPLLAVATWLLTRRLFPAANPMIAAALAVMSPTMIWEATTAYIDLALAFYVTLSLHALTKFDQSSDRRWLVLSALMMGAALSIKHLALLALVALAVVVFLSVLVKRTTSWAFARNAALFLLLALVLPAPWYARAYAASGNPFFPDLYSWFGARPADRWSPATERSLEGFKSRFGRPRSLETMLWLPWDMSVHGARYGGTFGPVFLILVPFACAGAPFSRSARFAAAGAGVYLTLWASPLSSLQVRFLVPLMPICAAFGAAGLAHLGDAATSLHARLSPIVVVPVAVMLLLNLPAFTRNHEHDRVGMSGWLTHVARAAPTRVVLGAWSVDEYLSTTVPSYTAWRFIDTTLPSDSCILTFSGGDHLYSAHCRLWSDATRAYPLTWGAARGQESAVLRTAQQMGISHVLFDKGQLADGSLADLAIGSARMRSCCLTRVWEDSRYLLERLELPRERPTGQ